MIMLILIINLFDSNAQKSEDPLVDNILLKEWIGPYEGVPAFDQMKVGDVIAVVVTEIDSNGRISLSHKATKK